MEPEVKKESEKLHKAARSKALEKHKKMKEGHNIITKDKIYNRLYPGGFSNK